MLTVHNPAAACTQWNFINSFREDLPDWTTLPGLFLDNGALAYGSGKTYHPKIPPYYDGNKSWSPAALPYFNPCWNTADDPKIPSEFQDGGLPCVPCAVDIEHYVFGKPISVATEMCETDAFEDTFTIERAVHFLQAAASSGKQWYLGVGLHKPHLPFQAAPEDWALHPLNSSTLPTHRVPPVGMPDVAFHFSESSVHSSPWQPLPDNDTLAARRGYAAAATGMDRKLGVLMSALDKLGLANSTAVVLHSDHGWQLGEHGEWRKMTNFELATRVPLIIRAPWVTGPGGGGARASGLVELVDIMPTIAELAGVPLPSGKTYDGTSLVPLLRNGSTTVKAAAFSQYPRHVTNPAEAWDNNGILRCPRSNFTHMGYSVRTRNWRYTEWVRWNGTSLTPLWDEVDGRELYDHRGEPLFPVDFNRYENVNVANATVNVGVVEALSKLLREGFPTVSSVDVSV